MLGNDSDMDGDALTAVLVSGPSHGSLILNADGSFSYVPASNYHGPDSFTYKVNDGLSDSNTKTVALTVNAALVIEEILVNDGVGNQRSNIESLSVRFNQDTNLQTLIDNGQILQAIRLFGSAELALQTSRFRYDAASRTLRIDLTTDSWGGSRVTMLADSRYQLRWDTRLITAAAQSDSHLLDRDGVDDFFGSSDFHRLLGDFDGEVVGPTGPGGTNPISGWSVDDSSEPFSAYEILLTGVTPAQVEAVVPEPASLIVWCTIFLMTALVGRRLGVLPAGEGILIGV